MLYPVKTPKKLIEVALPLDDINIASAREKSIRHGHPSTLHLWWARRPLATARAVLFAQLVNDPGYERSLARGVGKEKAKVERRRLFGIIRKLVLWENTNNKQVLEEAQAEIRSSWRETCRLNRDHPQAAELFNPDRLPAFHDPFAGGGSIPLEAQRLGLEAYASDLNPVAVLINKAMLEIPPKFADLPPVGPLVGEIKQTSMRHEWRGAEGLAEDVRRYGAWMREEAFKRIGHLYPQVELPAELGGGQATVIAWLWARTVFSPNPAFSHIAVPLVSTFMLSTKPGKEAYVEPILDDDGYRFTVRMGKPKDGKAAKDGTKLARGANFRCLMSNTPISQDYIHGEFQAHRNGDRLMAIVAEGPRGRIYLSPTPEQEALARSAQPAWQPEQAMNQDTSNLVSGRGYGITHWHQLFTPRQLVALTTFSDLIPEVIAKIKHDFLGARASRPQKSGQDDDLPLAAGGLGAGAYAEAVGVYLGLGVDRLADRTSTICSWDTGFTKIRNTFGRQAIPMMWDYAEGNPFSDSTGNFSSLLQWVEKFLTATPTEPKGQTAQQNATDQFMSSDKIISTDPPYYDNIGYADLSDFFYIWLRRSLKPVFPDLFATLATPKTEELIAATYRHGNKIKAEEFFLDGMTQAMQRLAEQAHPAYPVTIYYAFKQSDTSKETDATEADTSNTGWETFLAAVIKAGFAITGTWPMHTELKNRMVGTGTNALASSIILVCRQRDPDATVISRREFVRELNTALADAINDMINGAENESPVAPVDLAQAVIGPGMAIYSKYAAVLEANGDPVSLHTALILINKALIEGNDDFDSVTQFCLGWCAAYGWDDGEFGQADVLARAKGTSVERAKTSGVVAAIGGQVRLLPYSEYPSDWLPNPDHRIPIWAALQQLNRALQAEGADAAGRILKATLDKSTGIRNLAYRLHTLCERKRWPEQARIYNDLITSWDSIERACYDPIEQKQGNHLLPHPLTGEGETTPPPGPLPLTGEGEF